MHGLTVATRELNRLNLFFFPIHTQDLTTIWNNLTKDIIRISYAIFLSYTVSGQVIFLTVASSHTIYEWISTYLLPCYCWRHRYIFFFIHTLSIINSLNTEQREGQLELYKYKPYVCWQLLSNQKRATYRYSNKWVINGQTIDWSLAIWATDI